MSRFATGGFHGLCYVPETTFGVTPPNPQMKNLRHTSCSLQLSKDSFQSEELRNDAQITDLRHGTYQVGGDIGIEFSFSSFDDFLAAALRSSWQNDPMTGHDFLIAGIDTPSFTIERKFEDIKKYENFPGCQVSSFGLGVETNAMVTGTIGIIGKDAIFTELPLDSSSDPAPTFSPFDSFKGQLLEAGVNIPVITSLEFSIDNGIEAAFVVGSKSAEDLLSGRINITGTISAYFKDLGLLRKFVDEVETSIQFTLGDGISASYVFTFPRIKYSGGSNQVDGEKGIVMDMPFQALYDECTGTNIRVDRIAPTAVPDCRIDYDLTEFEESSTTPGTIETVIVGTLSGGDNEKTFNGRIGSEIPGFTFTGVPDGMTGVATKTDNGEVTLSIIGTATSAITAGQITVEFGSNAVGFGFCHCPNDEIIGRTTDFDLVV